ncbi:hypothetical protein D3C78_1615230 [compost metagenome]
MIPYVFPCFVGDFPFWAFFLKNIKIEVVHQFFGEIAADKRGIGFQLAYLKYFLAVPAAFDVFEDF